MLILTITLIYTVRMFCIIAGVILLLEVTILDGALTNKQEVKYFIGILVCILVAIILTGIADNIPTS